MIFTLRAKLSSSLKGKWTLRCVLILIFFVALVLRFYRMYEEFYSGDMCYMAEEVLNAIPDRWTISNFIPRGDYNLGNPIRLIAFPKGPLWPILTFINTLFFSLLGVELSTTVWMLPIIVIGALTPIVCFYLLFRITEDQRTALLGALFIMVFPFHVLNSRYSKEVLGFFGQALIMLSLMNHIQKHSKRSAWLLGLSIGLYLFMHNLWIGILPVIVYSTFVLVGEKDKFRLRTRRTLALLFQKEVIIIPVAALVLLIGASVFASRDSGGALSSGPLGYLLQKSGMTSLGWYGTAYFRNLLNDSGILMGIAIIFCLIFGMKEFLRLSKSSVLWFWAVCYIIPFLFYVSPKITLPRVYSSHGYQAMVLFFALMVGTHGFRNSRTSKATTMLSIILLVSSLYTMLCTVYKFDRINIFHLRDCQGSYRQPIGLKAAGYWLRKNTAPTAQVFFFDYGGMGMEPSNSFYYARRYLMALTDSPSLENTLYYLKTFAKEMDYLVIPNQHLQKIQRYVDSMFPYKVLRIETEEGQTIAWIFSKKDPGSMQIIKTNSSSRAFDKEFANLEQLTGLERFSIATKNPFFKYYNNALLKTR